MDVSVLLLEGLRLMLVGMGVVFAFLLLLVLAMVGMSRLAGVLEPAPPPLTGSAAAPMELESDGEARRVVAAISAAIDLYRGHRRG